MGVGAHDLQVICFRKSNPRRAKGPAGQKGGCPFISSGIAEMDICATLPSLNLSPLQE